MQELIKTYFCAVLITLSFVFSVSCIENKQKMSEYELSQIEIAKHSNKFLSSLNVYHSFYISQPYEKQKELAETVNVDVNRTKKDLIDLLELTILWTTTNKMPDGYKDKEKKAFEEIPKTIALMEDAMKQ